MTQQQNILDASAVPPAEYSFDLLLGGIKAAMKGVKSRDLYMLEVQDIDRLHVLDGLNVRVKDAALDAHIRGLAESMKKDGFKIAKPLEVVVLEDTGQMRLTVTDGHCRLAALKIALAEGADIKDIPLVTLPSKGTTLADLVVGLVTSNGGKNLTPFETSLVCSRLVKFGWSEGEIAQRLNFSESYVNTLLALASAPMSIVTMVQNGEVSASFAVETLRKHRGEAINVLQDGLAAAKAAGGNKVTKKYTPGAALESLVKRQATSLYEGVRSVTSDPGYSGLSEETRNKLDLLLKDIAEREKALDEKMKKSAEDAAKQAPQDHEEKEEAAA
ncbi:TPA: hypothetical protein VDU83_002611 [Pseudomonas aeruginosa]|nr:hypothetical protein [Pseudomonas aeruginosa]